MGRPKKPAAQRALNAGISAFPSEIVALRKIARAEKLRSGFDYVRSLVRRANHPLGRGKIAAPRSLAS